MDVALVEAKETEAPVLERLLQLYAYDFSEHMEPSQGRRRAGGDGRVPALPAPLGGAADRDEPRRHGVLARHLIVSFTASNFTEAQVDTERWRGPVQTFDARDRPRA